jgi:hypothetical protein
MSRGDVERDVDVERDADSRDDRDHRDHYDRPKFERVRRGERDEDCDDLKPVFNTGLFRDIVTTQMNRSFADLLYEVLDEFERLEPEIHAFKLSLVRPGQKPAKR